MGWQVGTESNALGVLGLAKGGVAVVGVRDYDWSKDEPLTHGYG